MSKTGRTKNSSSSKTSLSFTLTHRESRSLLWPHLASFTSQAYLRRKESSSGLRAHISGRRQRSRQVQSRASKRQCLQSAVKVGSLSSKSRVKEARLIGSLWMMQSASISLGVLAVLFWHAYVTKAILSQLSLISCSWSTEAHQQAMIAGQNTKSCPFLRLNFRTVSRLIFWALALQRTGLSLAKRHLPGIQCIFASIISTKAFIRAWTSPRSYKLSQTKSSRQQMRFHLFFG